MITFVHVGILRWFDKIRAQGEDYLKDYGFTENQPNLQQFNQMKPIGMYYPFIDDVVNIREEGVRI